MYELQPHDDVEALTQVLQNSRLVLFFSLFEAIVEIALANMYKWWSSAPLEAIQFRNFILKV